MIHQAPLPVDGALLLPARHSTIAGVNALFRMKETARRSGRILEDRWAAQLADDRLLVNAIRFGRFALPPLGRVVSALQTAHCVRHRAIDELILRAVEKDGFRQVVVVGAGYDMRASRFAARIRPVRWFELDLPETIDRKLRLLGRELVRPYEPQALDLGETSVLAALERTSFDPDWPTLFVMEGLIHYLPAPRLRALLSDVAVGRGRRRAVMSFIRSEVYAEADRSLVTLMRLLGEIPRLHFAPAELAAECAESGLGSFRSWSSAEQIDEFAPEARRRAVGSAQDVAQADR